jgi:hypothetical protein
MTFFIQWTEVVRICCAYAIIPEFKALLNIPPALESKYDICLDFKSQEFDSVESLERGVLWGASHRDCRDNLSRLVSIIPGASEVSWPAAPIIVPPPKKVRIESKHLFETVAEETCKARPNEGISPFRLLLECKNSQSRVRVMIRNKDRCYSKSVFVSYMVIDSCLQHSR